MIRPDQQKLPRCCIVKIGGSLHADPRLPAILEHWRNFLPPPVIVAGGGPFADQVRLAQKHWAFPDSAAHRMAVLGMHQYALMLSSLGHLPLCSSGRLRPPCVWRPTARVLPQRCRQDWTVTSDTIALALAKEVEAQLLLLIKPVLPDKQGHSGYMLDEMFWQAKRQWQFTSSLDCAIVSAELCSRIHKPEDVQAYRLTGS